MIRFYKKDSPAVETPCMRSLNILGHAQIEEIELGSRCGGYGECGGDKVQILKGREFLSPVTESEREHLTADEIQSGMRLGCQCFPISDDVDIDVEVEVQTF